MKKQYSKKQILEAIKYWTRQLNTLDESKMKVIDDLIEKFGEDTVLSKTREFRPNTNDLRQIYDILNFRLFDNTLENIPVTAEHSKNIADRLNIYNEVSRGDEPKLDDINVYGIHLAAVNETDVVDGKTTSISIFDNIIMLNRDLMVPGVFIFIVSSLCHEMIHYCTSFSDELRAHVLKSCNDPDYKYDSHNDPLFQEKMSQANDNGLHVTKTVRSGDEYQAYIKVKNVMGEDEEFRDTIVRQGPGHICVINKRTGRGFYADFD